MKNVAAFSLAMLLSTTAQTAEYMEKTPFQLSRAFSPGVITRLSGSPVRPQHRTARATILRTTSKHRSNRCSLRSMGFSNARGAASTTS